LWRNSYDSLEVSAAWRKTGWPPITLIQADIRLSPTILDLRVWVIFPGKVLQKKKRSLAFFLCNRYITIQTKPYYRNFCATRPLSKSIAQVSCEKSLSGDLTVLILGGTALRLLSPGEIKRVKQKLPWENYSSKLLRPRRFAKMASFGRCNASV